MMRVAVLSDLHFDEQPNLSTTLPSGISSRLQHQKEAFEWSIAKSMEQGATTLVITGDIFDSRTTLSLSVIDVVCRLMHEAQKHFSDGVHVLVGNHDSWLRTPTVNSLQMLRGTAIIHEAPGVFGPLAFVPWTKDHEEIRQCVASLARKTSAEYLISHLGLNPILPNGVPIGYLQASHWKRVILGDIHDPIDVTPTVHYVGALMQQDYGDAGTKRGMLLLDTESDSVTRFENKVSPRFNVITTLDEAEAVKQNDFIRVKSDDPEIIAAARKGAKWVEANSSPPDEPAPRMAVGQDVTQKEVLTGYVQMVLGDVEPELLELGLDILAEAKP
jgi:DNA repair exonuclease SbcCD nuclease subunit